MIFTLRPRPLRPHYAPFAIQNMADGMAGLVPEGLDRGQTVHHQCFPLAALLLALGGPKVHYLSLDIEGAELQVTCNPRCHC